MNEDARQYAKRKLRPGRGRYLLLWLMFITTGGLIYLFVFSDVFVLKEVEVRGAKIVSNDLLAQKTNEFVRCEVFGISRSSLLFFSAIDLEKFLKENFPRLREAVVQKEYFHKLSIRVSEREIVGVWCGENGGCFYFDEEGIAFEEAPFSRGSLILAVRDFRGETGRPGGEVITKENIFLIGLISDLFARNINTGISSFSFLPRGEIRAETSEGWQVYFNEKNDPELLVRAVEELFQKDKSVSRNNLEYIDLRTEGKAFYK